MTRLLLAATVALVAWGALAFGAVYPWAWKSLIGGCAALGVASMRAARSRGGRADDRWLLLALLVVAAAAVVQIVPLPRDVRLAVSPASEPFLVQYDLEYAVAVATQDSADATGGVPARALSIHRPATVRGIVLLMGLVVYMAGLTRLLAVTGSRRLVTPVVAFGVLLALIAIIQYAVLGDHAYLGMKIYGFWAPRNKLTTPFGPFVNKNHFAGWMLMGVPLAIGLGLGWFERGMGGAQHGWRALLRWVSSPEGGKAQIALLAATLMGVALLMARSRSGIIGFVVALLLTTGVVSRRFGGARTRLIAFGVLGVVLIAAFGAAQVNLADRFTTGGASIELRRHIWRDAASVIRDFPIAGTGLNTFSTAMTRYQTPPRDAHFQEAHNDYLQVVVEGGLLLAVPAAAALVLLVLAIRRRFASGHDEEMSYWLRVGATTGLVAIGLQSLVEFSLQMPGNAVMAATLMAIALHEAPRRVAVPVREPARLHRRRATA